MFYKKREKLKIADASHSSRIFHCKSEAPLGRISHELKFRSLLLASAPLPCTQHLERPVRCAQSILKAQMHKSMTVIWISISMDLGPELLPDGQAGHSLLMRSLRL